MEQHVVLSGEDVDIDLEGVWKTTIESLRQEVPANFYSSMIAPSRLLSLNDGTCMVGVQNEFTKDIIKSRFLPVLEQAISRAVGRQVDVMLTIWSGPELIESVAAHSHEAAAGAPAYAQTGGFTPASHGTATLLREPAQSGQPKKYTFDNFVVGDSNKLAYNAAIMVAESPGQKYNPLFFYGGTGLGKTHLMYAIEDYARTLNPGIKVKYVQTSGFIDEFIAILTMKRDKATFDQKYINNKIVLFDDIQALSGTDATQNKFFDVFNLLYAANSHIVISSDRPPREMSQLSDRIQSRFEGGLMVDIAPPDIETRLAILQMKAKVEGVQVPDDAMVYIASKVNSNIRALEGLLNRVVASARLYGTKIDLPMVQDVLKDQVAEADQARTPTMDVIQSLVSTYYEITKADLIGQSRSRSLVHGRHVAMYLCRELTNETLISIGSKFGDRDHSTVLHSCRKIETMIKQRREVLEEVRELTNMINKSS
jgi:chromosomal replication initiator protein